MTARRVRPSAAGACVTVAALLLSVLALAACGGQSAAQRTPDLGKLPLVPGARVIARVRSCDPGANAFCAWELVVGASGYRSPMALAKAEHRYLESLGWTSANADTGQQRAQDSPGHKARVTYATPQGDLQSVELGWIKRSQSIQLALSRAMFERRTAISMLYEVGAS